jgi:lipid II:glycine glycyltransferase (peptidoglycan interpeptide bridge formation enzyme)
MGAGSPDQPYGVRDFKAEFGGELVEHGRFLCVRKPMLYAIGKMGVKLLKQGINLVK